MVFSRRGLSSVSCFWRVGGVGAGLRGAFLPLLGLVGHDNVAAPFGFSPVVVVRYVRGALGGLRHINGLRYAVMWGFP